MTDQPVCQHANPIGKSQIYDYDSKVILLSDVSRMQLKFTSALGLICTMAACACAEVPTVTTPVDHSEIEILVIKDVLKELPQFLQDDTIDKITQFNRPQASRDIIDYVLLRQALAIGLAAMGDETVPKLKITPWHGASYNRVSSNLKLGKFTLFSNTLWREDFIDQSQNSSETSRSQNKLYLSSPTLNYGEFEAGLYMNPANPKYQQYGDNLDLSQLRAVSSSQWRPDWQALKQLPLKQVYDEVNWDNMMKMVQSQRADFMLVPFSREPDLSLNALGMTLMPIRGVKMALAGSRGWAISRIHPSGHLAYEAIEKGLLELRRRKVIPRAYIEAGVINAAVTDWKILNSSNSALTLARAQIPRPQSGQQQHANIRH